MPSAKEVYINCDILDKIPELNRKNWVYETDLLKKELSRNAKVLQIGCMDGTRIISLLNARLDLKITGLEIEKEILDIAKENLKKGGLKAELIHGDITKPLNLSGFDYAICLNNTLGYIKQEKKAIENMKKIGGKVVISVYGEKFTDEIAKQYFSSINLEIDRIENNIFHLNGFADVKRYTKEDVMKWKGKAIETPLGYFCIIKKQEK